MSISEITKKVKASASTRSPEERLKLLKSARILNKQGKLDTAYFTMTIAAGKARESKVYQATSKTTITKRSASTGQFVAKSTKPLKASAK